MKRILTAGGAAVLLLLSSAGPAAAAPVVDWVTPTADQRFGESSFTFDAIVRMDGGTLRDDIVVTWAGPAGAQVPTESRIATGNTGSSKRVTLPNQSFPWNGAYTVNVRATGRPDGILTRPDEQGTGTQRFVVDAPPAPPTGVTTSVGGDRSVTVRWTANTEQQLVGYEVQRQLGSDPWEGVTVTDTTTTSVVDTSMPDDGGTYRYRVVAYRHSAEAGTLLASLPSGPSTAKVPAALVTTTTTTTKPEAGTGQTGSNRSPGRTTGTGTSNRSGATPTGGAGASGSSSSPTLSGAGKVDLSGFSSLLEQARQAGRVPPPAAAEEPDSGFDETLPFTARPGTSGNEATASGDEAVVGESPVSDDGSGRVRSLAFLAGGLLTTVLVMHLLWVRGEVRRAAELEVIAPEAAPERPRRQRATPSAWARFGADAEAMSEENHEPAAVG